MRKIIIYIVILIIAHCTLTIEDCEGQWYQVNLPIAGSIQQMQFVNQNTGWAVVKESTYKYTLIKTSNSGVNWISIFSDSLRVIRFQFINDTLGYGLGKAYVDNLLLKTTNGGYNWTTMQSSSNYALGGFYFVNADTGWVNAFSLVAQTTFMTTDGFQTLNPIATGAGGNPATIHFFKEPYNGGLCGYMGSGGYLWKTTNSGFNWTQLSFSTYINSFSFLNRDTGWVVLDSSPRQILKTTNSGVNWITQFYDYSGVLSPLTIYSVNYNKIWCSTNTSNHKIMVSTDGGNNWGNQTSPIWINAGIYMVDTILGFVWSDYQLIKTSNGGGQINSIQKISENVPIAINLKQNYPNPFNPSTNIEFQINNSSIVDLNIYDILGRKVMDIIVSKEFTSGVYKVSIDMNEKNLAGGVYFYKLTVLQKDGRKLFNSTKKMIYNK